MFRTNRAARLALAVTIPAVGLLGVVGLAAADDRDGPRTTPTVSTRPITDDSVVVDVSGPCDEAEHANDPRCTGIDAAPSTTVPSTTVPSTTIASPTSVPAAGEDISGPCDEAEHANDPRCTGGPAVDNRGDGTSDDDSNRGPGSGDDDDDRSGHGGGDDRDDSDDDHGSGGHGSDD